MSRPPITRRRFLVLAGDTGVDTDKGDGHTFQAARGPTAPVPGRTPPSSAQVR